MRFTHAHLSANSAVLATFDLFIAGAVGAVSCIVVFVNVSIDFGLGQTKTIPKNKHKKEKKEKRRRKDKEKILSKLNGQEKNFLTQLVTTQNWHDQQ